MNKVHVLPYDPMLSQIPKMFVCTRELYEKIIKQIDKMNKEDRSKFKVTPTCFQGIELKVFETDKECQDFCLNKMDHVFLTDKD